MNKRFHRNDLRTGAMMPDLIVAAILTMALIGTLTTCTIRSGRLMTQTRHQQLALDELSNQLERLLSLNENDRRKAMSDLMPSDEIASALPEASLAAETMDDQQGTRIVLSLDWNHGVPSTPMRLVGWTQPRTAESTE